MLNNWPLIDKNEYVDIIAPSGNFDRSNIAAIEKYLLSQGMKPRIPENILGDHAIFANSDEIRFDHLQQALNASDSTLIWCVRGGHGVTRIMPDLIEMKKPTKQKLLVGFSDISSLHLWLNQAWHWPSLHGPMARQTALGLTQAENEQALHQLWFQGLADYKVTGLKPLNEIAKNLQSLDGITSGGCMSVLESSLGTPWQIDGRDKILLLEDINEFPYRIDRSLTHLINAGVLTHSKAVIIGDLGENEVEAKTMASVLQDIIENYFARFNLHLPVFRLQDFGHGKRNKPVPFAVNAKIIKAADDWQLIF